MINVRLDPQLWVRVKGAAGERGITLERWVAEALDAHIALQQRGRGAQPAAAGADLPLTDLARRVAALEWAVDHLARAIDADLPDGPAAESEAAGSAAAAADGTMAAASGTARSP